MTAEPTPTVSIGVPVYNGERYLAEALDSLLAQSYVDFEVVISDNASTDGTEEICRSFAARDERIRYVRSDENRGGSWNFNRVVELSRGPYFRWAAHDDVVAPTYLERCLPVIEDRPDAAICHSTVEIVDADGVVQRVDDWPSARWDDPRPWVRFHAMALHSAKNHFIFGLIRRPLLDRIPPYGAYGNADGVLLGRLSLLGPFLTVDEPLQRIRVHEAQATSTHRTQGGAIDYRAWRQWIDAGGQGRPAREFPYWRIWGEHARSILAVDGVTATARLRCAPTVASWGWSRKGRLRRDVATAFAPN